MDIVERMPALERAMSVRAYELQCQTSLHAPDWGLNKSYA
jgi:hypothetical protein